MSTAAAPGRSPAKPQPGEPIRLYQDGKGRWRYRVTVDGPRKLDGKRQQITRVKGTLREARAEVTRIRAEVARGEYRPKDGTTLNDLLDRWIQSKRDDPDVREITVKGYSDVLLSVRARLGDRPVQSLTRRDIEGLRSWLATEGGQRRKGLSPRSVQYALTALKAALDRAVTVEGLLSENPFGGLKSKRRKRTTDELERWDRSELLEFRAVADTDPWSACWRLTLCGLRRSEIVGLSWDAVDFDAGTVTVKASRVVVGKGTVTGEPKSGLSWRTVPVESIHPGTMVRLRELWMAQGRPDSGLILLDLAGRPIYPGAYSDRFGELCRAAGVPVIHLHSVRHSVAYMLHELGVAPADAAALLGHTVAVHLDVYVFARKAAVQSAADRLGAALAGAL